MGGSKDKRTVEGCRKRVERLCAAGEPTGLVLKNWYATVKLAESLRPDFMPALSEAELLKALDAVVAEGAVFPANVKYALVDRKVQSLVKQRDLKEIVTVLAPFHTSDFDPYQPTLGGAESEAKQRGRLFEKLVFKELLCPMILAAEQKQSEIQSFCLHCLEQFSGVDLCELEAVAAVVYDESTTIWRALTTLLSCSLQPELLVLGAWARVWDNIFLWVRLPDRGTFWFWGPLCLQTNLPQSPAHALESVLFITPESHHVGGLGRLCVRWSSKNGCIFCPKHPGLPEKKTKMVWEVLLLVRWMCSACPTRSARPARML